MDRSSFILTLNREGVHQNVEANTIDQVGHEEAGPNSQIVARKQAFLCSVRHRIVPSDFGPSLLCGNQQLNPVRWVLFALSKGCLWS